MVLQAIDVEQRRRVRPYLNLMELEMRLNVFALLAASALTLGVSTANAADVNGTDYGYDWSGLYVGAHAGYLWGDVDVDYEGIEGGGDMEGFIGGALAGYNIQHDQFVFGVEGDFGLGDVDGVGRAGPIETYTYDMSWNGHLRARAGFAVDRMLFFVAGGVAMARHELGVEETYALGFNQIAPSAIEEFSGQDSQTHFGFTIGGGVEYALTDSALLRVEYLYDDYGQAEYTYENDDVYEADLSAHTVRAAVSFKF
jgi:outer membrane immunogenic protein